MMATGWPACSAAWAGGAKSTAVESGVTGHSTTGARDSHPKNAVVDQSAKALTTKATKVHEGNARDQKASWYFVSLRFRPFGVASFQCGDPMRRQDPGRGRAPRKQQERAARLGLPE